MVDFAGFSILSKTSLIRFAALLLKPFRRLSIAEEKERTKKEKNKIWSFS